MKVDDKIKKLLVSFVDFFEESLSELDEAKDGSTIKISIDSISNLHNSFPVELIRENKELIVLASFTKDLFVEVIEGLRKIEKVGVGASHVDVSLEHIMNIGVEFYKVVEKFRNEKSTSPIGKWY